MLPESPGVSRPSSELVETLLSRIESDVAPILSDLCNGLLPQSDADREKLALFAAIQMCRTWGFRRRLTETADASLRLRLREVLTDERIRSWLRDRQQPHDDRSVSAFRREALTSNWELEHAKGFAIETSLSVADEAIRPLLFDRPLVLLRFVAQPY